MKDLICTLLTAVVILVVTIFCPISAQEAASLKSMTQEHYSAIHDDDLDVVLSCHLPEFTMFLSDGHVLWESGFGETAENIATILYYTNILELRQF